MCFFLNRRFKKDVYFTRKIDIFQEKCAPEKVFFQKGCLFFNKNRFFFFKKCAPEKLFNFYDIGSLGLN